MMRRLDAFAWSEGGDEIRQIGPGTYLGKVYWGKKRLIDFALQFQ